MSLLSIIEEIKKITPLANEDVDTGPRSTLSNRRGRKAQSIEKLKQLKSEYANEVLKNAVFIITTGSEKDALSLIGSQKFNCFNADPEELFDYLADSISPVLYQGKSASPSLFETIGRYLEDRAVDLGIASYPQLLFKQQYAKTLADKDALQALIKKALNEQLGSELVGIQAAFSIIDQAVVNEFTGAIVPIILSTNDESLILSLKKDLKRLTSNVFVVAAGKTTKTIRNLEDLYSIKSLEEEKVKELLLEIKQSVKVK